MLALRRNALIVLWREAYSLEAVAEIARRLVPIGPQGIGVLGVSLGDVPLEGVAERQRLAQRLADLGVRVVGMASVIEGDGIREVMHRINLVTQHPCPLGLFGTVDEAASWLAPRLGSVSSRDLRRAVAAL
jgi:hypothetical protein